MRADSEAGRKANRFYARHQALTARALLEKASAFLQENSDFPLQSLLDEVKAGHLVQTRLGPCLEAVGVSLKLLVSDFEDLEIFATKTVGQINAATIAAEHEAVLAGRVGPLSARFKMTPNTVYADAVRTFQVPADGTRQTLVLGQETCWTSIQVLVRGDTIYPVFTARSIDIENGLLSDLLFWYRHLLKPLMKTYKLGMSSFFIGSLHLYIPDPTVTNPADK